MLTQLRFKNWRSLQDVVIDDLQPINVFIGANSSGKTNMLDALYFLRDAIGGSVIEAFSKRIKPNISRTIGIPLSEPLELELSFRSQAKGDLLTYLFSEQKVGDNGIQLIEKLWEGDGKVSLERDGTHVKAQTMNDE